MTTITTAAAAQAGVTVATIRTWCRRNVVAAAKVAGRWVIDTASLAHRIAIGAMRTRKQANMLDLTASYTYTQDLGFGTGPETHTITPKVRTRVRDGVTITSINGIHSLLADRIDAITDLGDRLHTIEALRSATIALRDHPAQFAMLSISTRDDGRISTPYAGTRDIPVDVVLDLAEQLRDQLAK